MSSARSITAAVNPPRAVYLDYPLGRTAGKPDDEKDQLAVMRATLAALEQAKRPGQIVDLPFQWRSDDSWKDYVMRPKPANEKVQKSDDASSHEDDRVERYATPQYQTPADETALESHCASCIFLEDVK